MTTAHELNFFNPWRELDRLSREVHQVFNYDDRFSVGGTDSLPLEVWVGEDGVMVHAPLPGITPDSLDISVLGQTVTLRGQRNPEPPAANEKFLRRERAVGTFSRSVQLPFRVDTAEVKAQYIDGVLTLTLPRSPEDKPQRINVQAA